jgi:hypothetical protein
LSEFISGEKWKKWKMDYLKWHLKQKVHMDTIIGLQYLKSGGII